MKKTIMLVAVAALSSAALSSAASYTLTNNSGPINTFSIVNSSGAFLNSGSVVIGSYLGADPTFVAGSTTMASILQNFTILNSGTMGTSGSGAATINGVFSVQTNAVDPLDDLTAPAAAPWLGKNLFFIVGNNTTILNSTEALIYRFGGTAIGSVEPTTVTLNTRLTASTTTGSVFSGIGGFNNFQLDPTPGAVSAANPTLNTVLLTAIPEPSAALLGMLGALGLLRRRR